MPSVYRIYIREYKMVVNSMQQTFLLADYVCSDGTDSVILKGVNRSKAGANLQQGLKP